MTDRLALLAAPSIPAQRGMPQGRRSRQGFQLGPNVSNCGWRSRGRHRLQARGNAAGTARERCGCAKFGCDPADFHKYRGRIRIPHCRRRHAADCLDCRMRGRLLRPNAQVRGIGMLACQPCGGGNRRAGRRKKSMQGEEKHKSGHERRKRVYAAHRRNPIACCAPTRTHTLLPRKPVIEARFRVNF